MLYNNQLKVEDELAAVLLPGEKADSLKFAIKEVSTKTVLGQLFRTNYRLIFKPNDLKLQDCRRWSIAFGQIAKINAINSDKSPCHMFITCKDERQFKFRFENLAADFTFFLNNLTAALQPKMDRLFCNQWKSEFMASWASVRQDVLADFERLEIPTYFTQFVSQQDHRTATLPRVTYVIKRINQEQWILEVSKFRNLGRLPTVTFLHKKTGYSLFRGSEPEPTLMQAAGEDGNSATNDHYFAQMTRGKTQRDDD